LVPVRMSSSPCAESDRHGRSDAASAPYQTVRFVIMAGIPFIRCFAS
jgi:hypothetical protein